MFNDSVPQKINGLKTLVLFGKASSPVLERSWSWLDPATTAGALTTSCPAPPPWRYPKCLWSQSLPQAPAGSSCWAGGAQGTLLWVIFAQAVGDKVALRHKAHHAHGHWQQCKTSFTETSGLSKKIQTVLAHGHSLMGGMAQLTAFKDKSGKEALKKKPGLHVLCILLLSILQNAQKTPVLLMWAVGLERDRTGWVWVSGTAPAALNTALDQAMSRSCGRSTPFSQLGTLDTVQNNTASEHPVNNTGKKQQKYRWDFPLLTFSITHKIMMEWFSITHMATDKQELDIKQSQCFKKIPNPQHLYPPKCRLTSAPISVNFCRQNPDGTREWYRPPRARMKLFK